MRTHRIGALLGSLLLIVNQQVALSQSVPGVFQDLYPALQNKISNFDAKVTNQWNGATPPIIFSGELVTANANRGGALLSTATYEGVRIELSALQSIGVKGVDIQIGFPILYKPFFDFSGKPADYNNYLNFYKQIAADIRNRGLKLIVQSGPLFPGFYSAGSGLDFGAYYKTLSQDEYIRGRAQVIATIAQEIRPDYLSMGSEPDTEAAITGQSITLTPEGMGREVSAFIQQVKVAGVSGVQLGAGVGTWSLNAQSYVNVLLETGIDYLDFHVYPINFGFLDATSSLVASAEEGGKTVAISETWLLKERDSEFAYINAASDPEILARDAFSFWAPLDQAFLASMVKFANWKQLKFVSAFGTLYFWSYIDYARFGSLPATDILNLSAYASATALVTSQVSSTGEAFRKGITRPTDGLSLVSAASFAGGPASPDEIISIFGRNLANGTAAASSVPLPTTLVGTTVMIKDSSSRTQNLGLVFVSPGQINAIMPSDLAGGLATLSVQSASTSQSVPVAISTRAPGLFSKSVNGEGVAAGVVTVVREDGTRTSSTISTCGSTVGTCVGLPIDFGGPGDQVYVSFFGTGIRHAQRVTVRVGSTMVPVTYAGLQPTFDGLDQANVRLPRSLKGKGDLNVQLTADGINANIVTITTQ
jgi:uncharacterized protein (TIGR03437 family)